MAGLNRWLGSIFLRYNKTVGNGKRFLITARPTGNSSLESYRYIYIELFSLARLRAPVSRFPRFCCTGACFHIFERRASCEMSAGKQQERSNRIFSNCRAREIGPYGNPDSATGVPSGVLRYISREGGDTLLVYIVFGVPNLLAP